MDKLYKCGQQTAERRRKRREYMRVWRAANPERARELNRDYQRRRRERNPEKVKQYYSENRDKFNKYASDWRARNREELLRRRKEQKLVKNYGLTLADVSSMLSAQGGRCAICSRDTPGKQGWHVDHDHVSCRVRGILCHRCNTAIGSLKECPGTIRRAADYVEQSGFKFGPLVPISNVESHCNG